jgi:hypothetical protein
MACGSMLQHTTGPQTLRWTRTSSSRPPTRAVRCRASETTVSSRAVPLGLAVCDLLVADIRAGARGAIMQANRRCRRSCLPVTAATGSGPVLVDDKSAGHERSRAGRRIGHTCPFTAAGRRVDRG